MTKIVGILNITPDSFFDGNKHNKTETAIEHLKTLVDEGADIIDIGAESTRPNAVLIDNMEEWQRLKDILPKAIKYIANYNQENKSHIQISLDSRHPQNVAKALDLGIDIINDVSGFDDLSMVNLAAKSGKKIVVMHNLGLPANHTKIVDPSLDIVEVIIDWMQNKLQILQQNGIKKEQIIFDIGIGFGKNAQQSIELLQRIDQLRVLKLPLYVGHSNKSFLNYAKFGDDGSFSFNRQVGVGELKFGELKFGESKEVKTEVETEVKTLVISSYLAKKNVEYIRVHNVLEHIKTLSRGRFANLNS